MEGERPPGDFRCGSCNFPRVTIKRRRIDEPDDDDNNGGNEIPQGPLFVCNDCVSHPMIAVPGPLPQPHNATDDEESDEEVNVADVQDSPVNVELQPAAGSSGGSFSSMGTSQDESGLAPHMSMSLVPVAVPAPSPVTSSSNILARVGEFGWQEDRPNLTQRAGYLLNNSRMSDVRFLVGETKTEVFGHKTLLALGSPVFEAQFFGAVGQGPTDTIELPDMEPETFLMFLKYLYTDELDEDLDDAQLLNLLRPAKKYIVPHLVDKCSDILMTELKPENIFQILHHAQFYQLRKLERACERYIDRNSHAIVISEEFTNLTKPVLTEFLKRDGLNINEEALFQAVLRWATAECQRSSVEPEFGNLRLALGECLRLVRFPTMSKEEFAVVFETTGILSPEEACSVFVYMCKSENALPPPPAEGLVFPTTKRNFKPSLKIASRFAAEPTEHSLNYRSGEIYNWRINFKVDRQIFVKGVNIFSIRCGTPPIYHPCKRDFNGALYLYEKGAPSGGHDGRRKQFTKPNSLEPDENEVRLNNGRRQYYPVLFDSEIPLEPGRTYTVCVVVSINVNSHSYQAQPLQTYVGMQERTRSSVVLGEDPTINFTFLGSSADGSVGRFTSAQIPELLFCL